MRHLVGRGGCTDQRFALLHGKRRTRRDLAGEIERRRTAAPLCTAKRTIPDIIAPAPHTATRETVVIREIPGDE